MPRARPTGLTGRQGRRLADRLEHDHDNLRAALDWAVANGEVEYALRFIVGRVALLADPRPPDRGLGASAARARPTGRWPPGSGSPCSRARRRREIAYWRGDGIRTHELYRDALEQARSSGDPAILAEALTNFGFASRPEPQRTQSVYVAGRPYFEEAVGIYRELGDRDGLANATWALASSYMDTREFDTARGLIEESLAIYRDTDNRFGMGWCSGPRPSSHFGLTGSTRRSTRPPRRFRSSPPESTSEGS